MRAVAERTDEVERLGAEVERKAADLERSARGEAELESDFEIGSFSSEEREFLGGLEFAICVGRFYGELAERLVNSATEAFAEAGVSPASLHTFDVPGAFELPLAAKLAAGSGRFAGVACLGA